MPEYTFTATNRDGKSESGVMTAESEAAAREALRGRGMIPIKVAPQNAEFTFSFNLRGKPKLNSLSNFCRQMSIILRAGMPILRGLEIMQRETSDLVMRDEIKRMHREVLTGRSLSEAMASEESRIPPLLAWMVNTGEASGTLDMILRNLGDYYEQEYTIQKKVRGAMVYPIILGLVSVGLLFFVFQFLMPQIETLMASSGAQLPAITLAIINFGKFFRANLVMIIIGLGALIAGIKYYLSTPEGRFMKDQILFKLPVFGKLAVNSATARMARTAGVVVKGGIPWIVGLRLVRQNIDNALGERAVDAAIEGVQRGESLAYNLGQEGFFDEMAIHLMRLGEETGNMEEMLDEMVVNYEREVQNGITTLLSLVEPVMLLFMGVVIGGIVVASILPLFDLIGKIKR
ncbi:MAG: type II secretion system F family protein [Candidatus Saccharibacteria bacterium]